MSQEANRNTQAREWQARIEGEWHGLPAVFDAEGNHVGFIKVSRASTVANGRTTYTMDTAMDVAGPLRARFAARDFAFGVTDQGRDRVYMGPDFYGAGQPWGAVVDAHYYSPAWMADLRTMVHVLPDGTQAYSSLLYDGPTIVAVFNGLYTMAHGYGSEDATTHRVDAFLARERAVGPAPHVLPFKRRGRWTGELQAYGPGQEPMGIVHAAIDYRPQTLLRASVEVSLEGAALTRRFRYDRARVGSRHVYEGPDVFGNAMGYGRALYTTQHFHREPMVLTGREFLMDDAFSLSVVWQIASSGERRHVLAGLLRFEPGEEVLPARY